MKLESRVGVSKCLPPFLCSKLRKPEFLCVADDPAFHVFGQRCWNKRGTEEIAASLLGGEVAHDKLMGMGFNHKVMIIYQFDLSEQFADTTAVR